MIEKLQNIALIRSGYHFKESIENDLQGAIQFIQLKDIDEYNKIDFRNLLRNKLDNVKPNQYIQQGDILFKNRGKNFTAAFIDVLVNNTIATSHFFIIKVENKNVIPEYLAFVLNDEPIQKLLKIGTGGTSIQTLNKKFLENIEITIPSIDIQNKIIKLNNLVEQEQKLLKRKIVLRKLLIDLQLRNVINKGQL